MSLSTIIITKNEEKNIAECIDSVHFSDEIIVIDNESSDRTIDLAKKYGAEVISKKFDDFSKQREEGLRISKSDWILYLDADERITNELKVEILSIISDESSRDAYKIKRKNFYFRKYEWQVVEKMERLFKKSNISGWHGKIHESPTIKGDIGELENPMLHFTHSDLTSMLSKTIKWSDAEAKIRLDANHPKMTWWRFPRVMISTFLSYYIKQKGYKLGSAGLVESVFQSYSTFITYTKLWELQASRSS